MEYLGKARSYFQEVKKVKDAFDKELTEWEKKINVALAKYVN